jgi:hypothetical protein
MERNHVLGMICGYYLSRFDRSAYASLGYGTQLATHLALGHALGVAPKSIKNWRDEFDPVHDNPRQGWNGREMYPTRRRTIEALGDLSESELLELIKIIVADSSHAKASTIVAAVCNADTDDTDDSDAYGLRGPTGVKAEKAFEQHHEQHSLPEAGRLIDRRPEQCGYDYEIVGDKRSLYVEVKGLGGSSGGVTFTDKEWKTAQKMGDAYFLAIVRRVGSAPEVSLIQSPFTCLKPKMRCFTTVQIGWSVGEKSLRDANS